MSLIWGRLAAVNWFEDRCRPLRNICVVLKQTVQVTLVVCSPKINMRALRLPGCCAAYKGIPPQRYRAYWYSAGMQFGVRYL